MLKLMALQEVVSGKRELYQMPENDYPESFDKSLRFRNFD
jgi:hypothetical protein